MGIPTRLICGVVFIVTILASNPLPAAEKDVIVVNTPDVNVANTPDVNVANMPDVNVANDEMNPVVVSGGVDAQIVNNPGVDSFWAHGSHETNDTGGLRYAISFNLDFTLPGLYETSVDHVPNGKIAVVEYLSCEMNQDGFSFDISSMLTFLTSAGGTVKSLHTLPWVETGENFIRAYFNGPVRLYANPGTRLVVQAGVSGPSTTSCDATGYFLSQPD